MSLRADDGSRARPGALGTPGFAVNGRFLVQPVTGVQRYAREVVGSLDRHLTAAQRRGTLVAPASPDQGPALAAIDVRRAGPLTGHAWEQAVLPALWRGPLLNLCNTAPLVRSKQIVCIHDANVFEMPESYNWRFRMLYRTLQPMIARRAAQIVTVSHDAAEQLTRHLPVALGDLHVLPNGHEHALRWNAAASSLFADQPQARPFVLLLGSRARHKNAGHVLRLAGVLDGLGLDLLVAGGDRGIFAASASVGATNVRILGMVSDDDLALLFSRALCLAFPSYTEGFGLPVLEAMALGCPVISSNRSSLPEICGPAALMASPDDPEAWTAHFTTLAHSADLRRELRERGRLQAERYSWSATARSYLDLCGSLS